MLHYTVDSCRFVSHKERLGALEQQELAYAAFVRHARNHEQLMQEALE